MSIKDIKSIAAKSNKGNANAELKKILERQEQEKLRQAELLRQKQEELRQQNELIRTRAQREAEVQLEEEQRETVRENLQRQEIIEQQQEQQAQNRIASKDITALQNSTGASPAQIAAAAAVTVAVAQNLTSNPAAAVAYNQDPHKVQSRSITTPPIGQDPTQLASQDPHASLSTKNDPEIEKQKSFNIGAYVIDPATGKPADDVLSNAARIEGAASVGATSGQQTAHGVGGTKLESVAKSSMAPEFGIDFKQVPTSPYSG